MQYSLHAIHQKNFTVYNSALAIISSYKTDIQNYSDKLKFEMNTNFLITDQIMLWINYSISAVLIAN